MPSRHERETCGFACSTRLWDCDLKVGSRERSYERVLKETPRAVEEDQLEVAETVVLRTGMLRAIGAELRQQKEKTAKLARLEAVQVGC